MNPNLDDIPLATSQPQDHQPLQEILFVAKEIEAAFYAPPIPEKTAPVAIPQLPQSATMKTCPICGNEIIVEARFCSFCRTQFEVTVKGYCTNCHIIVEADAQGRCHRCGNTVLDKQVESHFISAPPDAQPSSVPSPAVQPKLAVPAPGPREYLIVLFAEIPPSQGQLRELADAVSAQDNHPVELLDAIRITGAMPTTADSYVVTVALLACQKHHILIETSRDTIAFRPAVSSATGMQLGLITITIRS